MRQRVKHHYTVTNMQLYLHGMRFFKVLWSANSTDGKRWWTGKTLWLYIVSSGLCVCTAWHEGYGVFLFIERKRKRKLFDVTGNQLCWSNVFVFKCVIPAREHLKKNVLFVWWIDTVSLAVFEKFLLFAALHVN